MNRLLHHQAGNVALIVLIGGMTLGLFSMFLVLQGDNRLIYKRTVSFRGAVSSLCMEVSREAPIQANAYGLFKSKVLKLAEAFEIVEARLVMGTMPETTDTNSRIYTDRLNNLMTPARGCQTGSTPTEPLNPVTSTEGPPGKEVRFSFLGNLCYREPGASNDFVWQRFAGLNLFPSYHAGTFVGCEIKTKIRTFFTPLTVPSNAQDRIDPEDAPRQRLVWARDGYLAYPLGDDPLRTSGVTVAIAPQVPGFDTAPDVVPDPDIFRVDLLARGRYLDAVGGTLADLRVLQWKTGSSILAAPLLVDRSGVDVRPRLYQLYSHPSVVARQRLSSALIELLSRTGTLRTNTEVMVANPVDGGTDPKLIPPVVIHEMNQDLRDADSNPPLIFTRLGTGEVIDPFYDNGVNALPGVSPSVLRTEYHSLLARMTNLGYHIESDQAWRIPGRLRFSAFPASNLFNSDGSNFFEPQTNFNWGSFLTLWIGGKYQPDSALYNYFDNLNQWGVFNGVNASPTRQQQNLTASQVASMLGASMRCPFDVGVAGIFEPCSTFQNNLNAGNVFNGFEPDVLGVLKAWLRVEDVDIGGSPGLTENTDQYIRDKNNNTPITVASRPAVPLPGLYRDVNVNYRRATGATIPTQLVIVLQSIPSVTQLANIQLLIDSRLDAQRLPIDDPLFRRITVVFLPSREADATPDEALRIAEAFRANICSPTFQKNTRRRGNSFIPLIPNMNDPRLGCLNTEAAFSCTQQTSLADVYQCLLGSTGASIEALAQSVILNKNLLRTTKIF